ncbi:MAG: AAA family ATPase [Rhodobacteraceae bacterium]|nr:AAA family ATPase [Paracoccaceae bacterium]
MGNGVILGRFMPPHEGHVALVRTATYLVDRLTIILACAHDDPIPADVRRGWMEALFPLTRVVLHCTSRPISTDSPEWAGIIRRLHPEPINRVIGSEDYLVPLAKALNAQHFILDPMWMAFPANSADIRADAFAHWQSLPSHVRPWYQKRLTLVGPESTGKSYMADLLAQKFGGPYVPEYGRPYEKYRSTGPYRPEELHYIVDGHIAHRKTLALMAGPVLFEDTDPLLTAVWAEMLLGHSLPDLEARIELPEHYLLLDADTPWAEDPLRYYAKQELRVQFFEKIKAKLDAHGASYTLIKGSYAEREAAAFAVVEKMLDTPKGTVNAQ